MPDFFVNNNFYQGTSQACIIDLTPPTFAGINFLDVESRGQIRAGWSVATDATPPIRYEVYIQAVTSVGLFNLTNIISVTPNLQFDIFNLPDGSFLQNGVTYFVGVRAIDGVNNKDNNTVSQSVISTGVLTSIDIYESKASWSISELGNFEITAWVDKNSSLAIAPSAVLGSASYQVYRSNGTAIIGMSGTAVSANAAGLYVFAPVTNLIDTDNEHYQLRIAVTVDSEARVNFIEIAADQNIINIDGVADVDDSNQITGSFWAVENQEIATGSQLGVGEYSVYDTNGNFIGLTETGIVADSNGFFTITPVPLGTLDGTKAFIIKATVEINNEIKSNYITLGNEPAVYDCKAVFSINATNQLEASFWATKNQDLVSGLLLGTASYTIYDKNGVAVAGLTQSGIAADVNGYFHITPVSAILLSDLTHYTARIQITVAGKARVSTKGFTLLGT